MYVQLYTDGISFPLAAAVNEWNKTAWIVQM